MIRKTHFLKTHPRHNTKKTHTHNHSRTTTISRHSINSQSTSSVPIVSSTPAHLLNPQSGFRLYFRRRFGAFSALGSFAGCFGTDLIWFSAKYNVHVVRIILFAKLWVRVLGNCFGCGVSFLLCECN